MTHDPLLDSRPSGAAAYPPVLPVLSQRVLRTMPWAVLALNQQGLLTLVNPMAASLLGRPVEELLGQPIGQVALPDFPPALRAALLAAPAAPDSLHGEYFLPHCQQWIEMGTQPGTDEVLVYWQDVTRVKAQQQQYQALADNLPAAIVRWGADLRLHYANPEVERQLNKPVADLLGKTLAEMGLPAGEVAAYLAKVQHVFDTCQPNEHFSSMATPRGEQYYLSTLVPELHDGQVYTVLSISQNVTELKRAELEATAQAHFSTQLAAASPDRIVVRELATGRVRYANRPGYSALGYDLDQRLAAHGRGEVPFPGEPADEAALAAYWAGFATATDETVVKTEHRLRAADGSWQWYRMRGKVFARDAQGHPTQALSVSTCITAEKQAEAALQESTALLQAVFDGSLMALHVLRGVRDAAGRLIDFEVVLANTQATVLAGRPTVGLHMLSDWPHSRQVGLFDAMVTAVETGQPMDLERFYEGDGVQGWYRWTAVPLGDGSLASVEDVTARKQLEQELHASKDLLEAIFGAAPDSIEVLRAVRDEAGQLVDFEWVLTNTAAHRLLRRTDLVGRRLLAEEPELRASGVFERFCQVVKRQEIVEFEQQQPHNGQEAWFCVAAAPLGDGLVANWQDITEGKRAAAELLQLRLAQQRRLAHAVLAAQESERRLISESLHNGLGQMLYATHLHLDTLTVDNFAEGKRQAMQLLGTAIAQVRALSHQLMPVILDDFGLAAAVEDICRDLSTPQLPLHCAVTAVSPLQPSLALALYRMAQELAANIVKHAGATEAWLHLSEHDGWIELGATDNGQGFDPNLPGAGLRMLQDRVALLNGQLAITSDPRRGTEVRIRVARTAIALDLASTLGDEPR